MLQRARAPAKEALRQVLKLHIVIPERLLITFGNNLIFSACEMEQLKGVTLSVTRHHLNLTAKETQVLPKP